MSDLDEIEVAPIQAETNDVKAVDDATPMDAVVDGEGQTSDQPAKAAVDPVEEAKVSASKQRRERRKAAAARHKQEAAEAAEALRRSEEELARAKDALETAKPPKESDYADYSDFEVARSAFYAGKEIDKRQVAQKNDEAERRRKEVETVQGRAQEVARENWAAQRQEAQERYTDFDAVVHKDVPITQSMGQAMLETDVGADIAYYLGTHIDEAQAIAALDPIGQAMAIGRISATIDVPKPKTTTDAPDPIDPVNPKATAQKSWQDMTPDEYAAYRRAGGQIT